MIHLLQLDYGNLSQIQTLMQLQREILPGDRPVTIDNTYWWIAYDGDKPIGFSGYRASRQWCHTAYLCRAGVLSAYRGKGLQRRLIRVRERHAKRLGFIWAISDTSDNPASANNLIACGYRMYEPQSPWGWRHTCYWRKKL